MVGIGLIEKTVKTLRFLLVLPRFRAFDEPLDGIAYGSFVTLGYALA